MLGEMSRRRSGRVPSRLVGSATGHIRGPEPLPTMVAMIGTGPASAFICCSVPPPGSTTPSMAGRWLTVWNAMIAAVISAISAARSVSHEPGISAVPPLNNGIRSSRPVIVRRSAASFGITVTPFRMPTACRIVSIGHLSTSIQRRSVAKGPPSLPVRSLPRAPQPPQPPIYRPAPSPGMQIGHER